jgi:membrane dipeptidase
MLGFGAMRRFRSQLMRATVMALGSIPFFPHLADAQATIPVVDLHVDLAYQVNYKSRRIDQASGQLVASKLVEAGVVGLVLPLYVPNEVSPNGPRLIDIETSYARMLGLTQQTPPYVPPGSPQQPGHVMTWFALEGAAPFAERPEEVKKWVAHGVRIWGLVHTHDNALATSAGPGPRPLSHAVGLTEAGHELVRAIHAAHGIVDVSHASDHAILDILEHARKDGVAVVATHSNANRLVPHARNLTDEQLRAIAATNGVVGVNFHEKFLTNGRPSTLDDVVQQIRYIAGLVGVAHVGIGSDYEGGIRPPRELDDVLGYPRLARALRRAGFADADVKLIFSGNVMRLLGVAAI